MKKIFITFTVFFLFCFNIFAQDSKPKLNLKNVKKVKSRKEFKEEIIIKKPNQATEMPRSETKSTVDMKINIHDRIVKSNKLLY